MQCRANGIRLFLIQMHSPIVGTMAPHDQSIPLGFSMPCRDAMPRVLSPMLRVFSPMPRVLSPTGSNVNLLFNTWF
jgi:hypothetical protein